MTEQSTSLQKSELIQGLKDVVSNTNKANPSVEGLVLYGSRSRNKQRNDSDVDMIYVLNERGTATEFLDGMSLLGSKIDLYLSQFSIKRHSRNFVFTVERLREALSAEDFREYLNKVARYLDNQSVYIGLDGEKTSSLLEQVFDLSRKDSSYEREDDLIEEFF
jgi:predicted nucleotidyltransferase